MLESKVSIIVATFNAGKTLRRALESVISQKNDNWECIIVDGMSSDDTLSIVKEFEEKDKRFRHISEKDKGIFDAFNKGYKLAHGEWIYYLGADDEVKKDAFDVDFKKYSSADVIYGNIKIVFPNNVTKLVKPAQLQKIKYKMIANHQSVLMRKNVIERLGGFNIEYKICADFDLTQRAYLSGCRFVYLDRCLGKFSYSGVSSHYSFMNNIDHYKICKRNKANVFPLYFFLLVELRHFIGFLSKKYITKRL